MTDDEVEFITIDVSCIWKDVVGYEGLYQVSNFGTVKSLKRKRRREDKNLKSSKDSNGYFRVNLCKDEKRQTFHIARLVGIAFLEPVDGCPEIDHINRIKTDNRVENLRWADRIMQNQNQDRVLNAKHIYIFYDNRPDLVSHWKVKWRYEGENAKSKHCMTKQLAQAFAETLDKSRLVSFDRN